MTRKFLTVCQAILIFCISSTIAAQSTFDELIKDGYRIIASDASTSDDFGRAIAVGADTLVVGSDNAVYIYDRRPFFGTTFESGEFSISETRDSEYRPSAVGLKEIKIEPADGSGHYFGKSVLLHDGQLLIGDTLSSSVYIFDRTPISWQFRQEINAHDEESLYERRSFGDAMSVDGDRLVVSALTAAYVFRRSANGDWHREQKLPLNIFRSTSATGKSVAIEGNRIFTGYIDNSTQLGWINFFEFDGSEWVRRQEIKGPDGYDDGFATSIDVEGDFLLVGAPAGRKNFSNDNVAGSALIFGYDGAEWVLRQKLVANDGKPNDRLGTSVLIYSDRILLAGAPNREGQGGALEVGAVYAFSRNDAGGWVDVGPVAPPSRGRNDSDQYFGSTLAVSENGVLFIGADGVHDSREATSRRDSIMLGRVGWVFVVTELMRAR